MSDVVYYGVPGALGVNSQGESRIPYVVDFNDAMLVTVNHGLGYNPDVTVLNQAGQIINCSITHTSTNDFKVEFCLAQSGKIAYK